MARFINSDTYTSTGQGFIGNNMFVYCLNNPVCMVDHQGEDAIYVVDFTYKRGLPVVGHALLFVQDANGNWYKTEFAGNFPNKSTAKIRTVAVEKNDIEAFLSSGTTRYTYIEGDFSASYELAQDYDETNYGGYNFVTRNCLHYVKELLQVGTPDNSADQTSFYSIDVVPAFFYSTLMNNRANAIQNRILQLQLKGVHYVK